jgi:hypothetical protein
MAATHAVSEVGDSPSGALAWRQGQRGHRHGGRFDEIAEDPPWAKGRQLGWVADQHEMDSVGERIDKRTG